MVSSHGYWKNTLPRYIFKYLYTMWSATKSTISSLLSIETIIVSIKLVDEIWFPFFPVMFIVKFNLFQNLNFHICQAVAWKVEVITSYDTNNLVVYIAPVVWKPCFKPPTIFSNVFGVALLTNDQINTIVWFTVDYCHNFPCLFLIYLNFTSCLCEGTGCTIFSTFCHSNYFPHRIAMHWISGWGWRDFCLLTKIYLRLFCLLYAIIGGYWKTSFIYWSWLVIALQYLAPMLGIGGSLGSCFSEKNWFWELFFLTSNWATFLGYLANVLFTLFLLLCNQRCHALINSLSHPLPQLFIQVFQTQNICVKSNSHK